jgi:hypothetical protein
MRTFTCHSCGGLGHFAKACPKSPGRDLTGRTFGRWTVIELAPKRDKYTRWRVRCSCDAATEKEVLDFVLTSGESNSCGCAPHGGPRGINSFVCSRCGNPGHNITTCSATPIQTDKKRICSVCKLEKTVNDFSRGNYRCRPCNRQYCRDRAAARAADSAAHRICANCSKPKRGSELVRGGAWCKPCAAIRMRSYFAAGKAIGLDHDRKHHLRTLYRLAPSDYVRLLDRQKGLCAICETDKPSSGNSPRFKNFAVDHDHVTERVRGLLCANCNRGIGSFDDNVKLLLRAARYLERTPPTLVTEPPSRRGPSSRWYARRNRGSAHLLSKKGRAELLAHQKGVCAICHRRSERALHVDHDHKTNAVRGLLCHPCNPGLGLLRSDPKLLRKAASYLRC